MDRLNRKKHEYLRRVRRSLVCPRRERARLLSTARRAVDAFLEENPEADENNWETGLGSPEMMAQTLLDGHEEKETHLVKRGTILRYRTTLVLMAVLLFTAGFITWYYWIHEGYIEVTTIVYETDGIPAPSETFHITYHDDGKVIE